MLELQQLSQIRTPQRLVRLQLPVLALVLVLMPHLSQSRNRRQRQMRLLELAPQIRIQRRRVLVRQPPQIHHRLQKPRVQEELSLCQNPRILLQVQKALLRN